MRQKTVGELLKEERLKHGLSIVELAKKTNIRPAYLQSLEENQFDQLPAATFVKSYIKIYASVFQFDYEPLLGLLRRDFKESAVGRLVPQDFLTPVLKKRHSTRPIALATLASAMLFLTVLGYVLFQWYQLQKPPSLRISAPLEFETVGQKIAVHGQTEQDATLMIDDQPVSLQPDGSFSYTMETNKQGVLVLVVEAQNQRGKKTRIERHIQVQLSDPNTKK